MSHQVALVNAEPTIIAAVAIRTTFVDLPKRIRSCYDVVYAAIRAAKLTPQGHNVAVYRNVARGEADVEIGVQVSAPFADLGEVVCRQTPAGRAATMTYLGPYAGLPGAHAALADWIRRSDLIPGAVSWEVYGDWNDDPAQLRTDVFHLLAG
jgi:effector-binding domain-containing protein